MNIEFKVNNEKVPFKIKTFWWQEKGLSYTSTGYGNKIPTQYMIYLNNKWRRVYCRIFSNIGTLYVGKNIKEGIIVEAFNF